MSDSPTDQSVGIRRPPTSDAAGTMTPVPHAPQLAVSTGDLAHHLHTVVLDIPGVATLVPTMTTALSRLRRRRSRGRSDDDERHLDTSRDGVSVTVDEDAVTAVLDITVASTAPVLATALAVRSAAMTALESAHPGAYTVRVNVLGLEAGPHVEP